MRSGFNAWRNPEQEGVDLFPLLFAEDDAKPNPSESRIPLFDHHARYGRLRLHSLLPFIHRWFMPATPVNQLVDSFIRNAGINPASTIAVLYRGTDKSTEVRLVPPQAYLVQAIELLRLNPEFTVLIQTDQKQVRDLFVKEFGQRCRFIADMPVTAGTKVLHELSTSELTLPRLQFAQSLIAACEVVSRCSYIINHTGNMALWSVLYRGSTERTVQFDAFGLLTNELGQIQPKDIPKALWRVFRKRAARVVGVKVTG